jgi:hypothetical protein
MARSRKRRKRRRPSDGRGSAAGAAAVGPHERASESPVAPARAGRRRAGAAEPPPAPWGSFPLVELAVLGGIVLLVLGFVSGGDSRAVLILVGLLLCSIAGLEVAVREHAGGYRSHTLVLAGVPAVAVLALLFYLAPASLAPIGRIAIAAAVFGLAAWGLTRLFQSRSGGYAFRVRAPRRRP